MIEILSYAIYAIVNFAYAVAYSGGVAYLLAFVFRNPRRPFTPAKRLQLRNKIHLARG